SSLPRQPWCCQFNRHSIRTNDFIPQNGHWKNQVGGDALIAPNVLLVWLGVHRCHGRSEPQEIEMAPYG
ncbi:MAG: hypothetical protein OSB69_21810, partial [Alphaproteobacteria bacterium]|nr:hypothetical protein [Alphaproteobacteria bacterium]